MDDVLQPLERRKEEGSPPSLETWQLRWRTLEATRRIANQIYESSKSADAKAQLDKATKSVKGFESLMMSKGLPIPEYWAEWREHPGGNEPYYPDPEECWKKTQASKALYKKAAKDSEPKKSRKKKK